MKVIFGANRLEHLARRVSGLNLDKSDLRRLSDLVSDKLHDLLLVGVRHASYNGRDVIMEPDLPITRGLRESMEDFALYEEQLQIEPILEQLATYPRLEREPSQEVIDLLPRLAGTLIMVTTQLMTVVDPGISNPDAETWDRVTETIDLLI
ncbi:MAG: DUF1931 family protein [Chloroflexota bacterium]|nr:DUF1931 family protein [Chloroflexota bacterium]